MSGFAFAKSIEHDKSPELLKRKSALQMESNISDKVIRERSHKESFKIHT
jgi:hypothetical protein